MLFNKLTEQAMRNLAVGAAAILILAGCGKVREVERATTLVATKNLKVVATDLKKEPATKPHGEIIDDQAEVIEFAMEPTEEELAAAVPTVSAERLEKDPQAEASKSKEDTEEAKAAIDKARKESWWGWLTNTTFWVTTAGVALMLIKIGSKFTPYGPLVNSLLDPIIENIPLLGGAVKKSKKTEKAVGTLAATVESSLLGRYGLQAADKLLRDKFGEEYEKTLGSLSDGNASTTEGLFKWLAKSHAVDHPDYDQLEIDNTLNTIKSRMNTVGGLPANLKDILKNATSASS